jgi:hypothetical protein
LLRGDVGHIGSQVGYRWNVGAGKKVRF